MIFYSSLFYLIILINKIIGILQINFDVKNECSVRIETDNGVETCFNQQCSDYKNPWRVINSHIQDQPCYLHYLKLSFSNYDQLLVFIELQISNNKSLEDFFADHDSKLCMLDIVIDNIYPFNKNYFLSEDMLNKLGGQKQKIDILQIDIKKWYKSFRTQIQFIENDIVDKQPFQQITILYPCYIHQTIERLVLAKYLKYQEKSSCPTQIQIISNDDLSISDHDTIHLQKYKPTKIHYEDYNYIKKFNLTDDLFNKSNSQSNQRNLFAKIIIIFIIIILIIIFVIYHLFYSSSQSNNT